MSFTALVSVIVAETSLGLAKMLRLKIGYPLKTTDSSSVSLLNWSCLE
jgi:hypothetical protein